MLNRQKSYEETIESFHWNIPRYYNIATDICDRHASNKSTVALIYHDDETDTVTEYTFRELKEQSNRLANSMKGLGLKSGDRIGIVLPQGPEAAITHLAGYKIGAITVPLTTLFGPDALLFRLFNSGAKMIVIDKTNVEKIIALQDELPDLEQVIVTGNNNLGDLQNFNDLIRKGNSALAPVTTRSEDPAMLIYTSGTTGQPKGVLHAQRVLIGHIPGVEFPHNFAPQPGDCFWTPADWAWVGGLLDVLLPAWHHGLPVVAHHSRKFDPEKAFKILEQHHVRNTFMPPTALKMMRQVPEPRNKYNFSLRSVASGGEALGEEILEWGEETLGTTINEFYGQTETNLVIGNCHEIMKIKPGSMGKILPGHQVSIKQENGDPVNVNNVGEIAIKKPDPVMFLEYWRDPKATSNKFIGDWAFTGDLAHQDEDGYIWFTGRKDDLIISSGYRIGPVEVEDCILNHPSVSMAAVIGIPDDVRGSVVKAFIMLNPSSKPSNELAKSIQNLVKSRLAAHEYPREIEFVESLPLTTTGKMMRKELREREERKYQNRDRLTKGTS